MSTSEQTANRRIKQITMESIIKGTGAIDNPAFMQELKPIYDIDHPDSDYSPQVYQQFIEFCRQRLYPSLPREKALFEIGRASFEGYYRGTVTGRVMLAAIKIMSPARLMKLAARLWEDAGQGECEAIQLGPKKFRLHYRNFIPLPYGVAGIAIEGLKAAGAKSPHYQIEMLDSPVPYLNNFDIVFEWD